MLPCTSTQSPIATRSEEHTSELQSLRHLVSRLLLAKKWPPGPRPTASARPHPPPARARRPAPGGQVTGGARPGPRHVGARAGPPAWGVFFNDTATTEIYTLPLHDALPISISSALVWTGLSIRGPSPVAKRSFK